MGSKQYSNIKQHSEKIGQVLLSSFSRARIGRHDFRAQDFFLGGFMLGIMCSRPAGGLPPSWCPRLNAMVRASALCLVPPHLHSTAA